MEIEAVWKQYSSSLERFLLSKVSNPADAEDLLQSILIKTHDNLSTLTSDDSIKPWLFQIANRTIIDFYRAKAKRVALREKDLWYQDAAESEQHDLAKCVQPFIQALPEKYADLLTAIEINGLSQKEYASLNDISYSTLKSQVQKGRKELKNLFDQCCTFSVDRKGGLIGCDSASGPCDRC